MKKLAMVMDPIATVKTEKDTSFRLLLEAQARGYQCFYLEIGDLVIDNGQPMAFAKEVSVRDQTSDFYSLSDSQYRPLEDFDVIMMRKDPPFDSEFLYATHILELAEQRGSLVVNKPQSLRDCNEKLFATAFADCAPPHLVTRNAALLKAFHAEHDDVIFKPLDGMGGSSIFRLKADDPNVSVIIETLTEHGKTQTMAQKYLPEISDGDKRILMIDGEPIDYCLARLPAKGETRGNLAAGGKGRAQPLTDRDRWIASRVAPELKRRGLLFVGLDVIGDYLTEINVTSPTCIREIDAAYDTDIGGRLMDVIAQKRGIA
jgi:glutathione synthase